MVCLCGPWEGTTDGEKINVTAPQEPSKGPEFCLPAEYDDGAGAVKQPPLLAPTTVWRMEQVVSDAAACYTSV